MTWSVDLCTRRVNTDTYGEIKFAEDESSISKPVSILQTINIFYINFNQSRVTKIAFIKKYNVMLQINATGLFNFLDFLDGVSNVR